MQGVCPGCAVTGTLPKIRPMDPEYYASEGMVTPTPFGRTYRRMMRPDSTLYIEADMYTQTCTRSRVQVTASGARELCER